MTWEEAVTWAEGLEYEGFTDWRLPRTLPVNGTSYNYTVGNFWDGGVDVGYNISAPGSAYLGSTGSEMAHLYYTTLGNLGFYDLSGIDNQPGWDTNNVGPFINLLAEDYWSGTEFTVSTSVWDFDFGTGRQSDVGKTGDPIVYAWAVRDGYSPVPATGSTLVFLGLALVSITGLKAIYVGKSNKELKDCSGRTASNPQ